MAVTSQIIGKLGGGLVWKAPVNPTALSLPKVPTLCQLTATGSTPFYRLALANGQSLSATFESETYVAVHPGDVLNLHRGSIQKIAEIPG